MVKSTMAGWALQRRYGLTPPSFFARGVQDDSPETHVSAGVGRWGFRIQGRMKVYGVVVLGVVVLIAELY